MSERVRERVAPVALLRKILYLPEHLSLAELELRIPDLPPITPYEVPERTNEEFARSKEMCELKAAIGVVRHHLIANDVWRAYFTARKLPYTDAALNTDASMMIIGEVLHDPLQSPFYNSQNRTVYATPQYFLNFRSKYWEPANDSVIMYVLHHEHGHHAQKLSGILDRVNAAKNAQQDERTKLLLNVALELQNEYLTGFSIRQHIEKSHAVHYDDLINIFYAAVSCGSDLIALRNGSEPDPQWYSHGSGKARAACLWSGLTSDHDPGMWDLEKFIRIAQLPALHK